MSKLLRVAGKDQEGLAKGIKVTEDGEIVATNGSKILKVHRGTLAPGKNSGAIYTITGGRPCRVFIFVSQIYIPWEFVIADKYVDTLESNGKTTEYRNLLSVFDDSIRRSDYVTSSGVSQKLTAGYGGRGAGWSNLTEPEANSFRSYMYNKSETADIDYTLVFVSYPYEALIEDKLKSIENILKSPDGKSERVLHDATLTDTNTSSIAYDSNSYTRIEHLDFSSNSTRYPTMSIQPKNKDGSLQNALSIANSTTGMGSHISMETIVEYNSSLFDVAVSNGRSTIVSLNRYMTFPHGLRITLEKANVGGNVSCAIRGYFLRRD